MVRSPHSVIGLFSNPRTAQEAVEQLTANGFAPDHVDISDHDIVTTENPTGEFPENDSLHHFMRRLFTSDSEEQLEAEASHRGGVVAVHLQTHREAEHARELLNQYGAVRIHELGIGDRL
ncbi:hypothetical protein F0P96_17525 [Hymenobacter busanensis]|uniref:Heat induced stress protein YflT n=1 Tax=Hymenobacter busanensis TaxID=2607656 RepID=A0A7L5A448_9BACT|nr:general stress protein [Hymenobacter busanensis]KAA9327041.1 hypothetical protein F0P96_17525 [Hymenobacter busanensis]QHJ09492.1 hypothetical protein GUY19_20340 [Hymenobacter busanensis]